MSDIFTRKALNDIMSNEGLTPEQRTEQVFGLYGRALDDGYIGKKAAQQAQQLVEGACFFHDVASVYVKFVFLLFYIFKNVCQEKYCMV